MLNRRNGRQKYWRKRRYCRKTVGLLNRTNGNGNYRGCNKHSDYIVVNVNKLPGKAHHMQTGSRARVTRALFTDDGLPVVSEQDNRMEDWVSTHSHMGPGSQMDDLQRRARCIIEEKDNTRLPIRTLRSAMRTKEVECEVPIPEGWEEQPLIVKGVEHLK